MKYIGVIRWNDDSDVLDNTTVSNFKSVWKQCCKAHNIHSGNIYIYEAKFDNNNPLEITGKMVKGWDCVALCREEYKSTYNEGWI